MTVAGEQFFPDSRAGICEHDYHQDRCEMIPIDEVPLQAVRAEFGDTLDGSSSTELCRDALARARRQALEELNEG